MTGQLEISDPFLKKLESIVQENLSNEQFGVSELADAVSMSRSNLLRKVKKLTNLSVSQFIREVRLQEGKKMLENDDLTISEISFKVGFGSTSYFIKCFKDLYGFPPGELGKKEVEIGESNVHFSTEKPNKKWLLYVSLGAIVLLALITVVFSPFQERDPKLEKSIGVLPFKNDSNDSTNVYIINGLMESTLNNLQKIDELRVISRTSVEKFRQSNKTIPELGSELNVNYLIEGSGQKIGDQILLTIQLIEAPSDEHLWSRQYSREAKDIFTLQQEIAQDIANEIEVIISPEVEEQISKIPTKSLEAYDYFLRGVHLMNVETKEGFEESIEWFQKALELDIEYAAAYGNIAISYYYLDLLLADKKNSEAINEYADKALLRDPKLPQALIAKALYYVNIGEYDLALSPMELAIKYNPSDPLTIHTIANYYTTYRPNTRKYLEYALKGFAIDRASYDSTTISYSLLHICNSLIQTGFQEEAEKYVNLSLAYDSSNSFSGYVKAYITYVKHRELQVLRDELFAVLEKDTTRLDVLQEVAKICYFQKDYELSYRLYKSYQYAKETYNLNLFPAEDVKIAAVFREMGDLEKAEELIQTYKEYCDKDVSMYKDLSLMNYYVYRNQYDSAMYHFEQFTDKRDFMYWVLVFMETDPMSEDFIQLPEYKKHLKTIENNFWTDHEEIREMLEAEGLI